MMADIKSRGFDEAIKRHSLRRDEVPIRTTLNGILRNAAAGFPINSLRPTLCAD